jgi:hypothetical protein
VNKATNNLFGIADLGAANDVSLFIFVHVFITCILRL